MKNSGFTQMTKEPLLNSRNDRGFQDTQKNQFENNAEPHGEFTRCRHCIDLTENYDGTICFLEINKQGKTWRNLYDDKYGRWCGCEKCFSDPEKNAKALKGYYSMFPTQYLLGIITGCEGRAEWRSVWSILFIFSSACLYVEFLWELEFESFGSLADGGAATVIFFFFTLTVIVLSWTYMRYRLLRQARKTPACVTSSDNPEPYGQWHDYFSFLILNRIWTYSTFFEESAKYCLLDIAQISKRKYGCSCMQCDRMDEKLIETDIVRRELGRVIEYCPCERHGKKRIETIIFRTKIYDPLVFIFTLACMIPGYSIWNQRDTYDHKEYWLYTLTTAHCIFCITFSACVTFYFSCTRTMFLLMWLEIDHHVFEMAHSLNREKMYKETFRWSRSFVHTIERFSQNSIAASSVSVILSAFIGMCIIIIGIQSSTEDNEKFDFVVPFWMLFTALNLLLWFIGCLLYIGKMNTKYEYLNDKVWCRLETLRNDDDNTIGTMYHLRQLQLIRDRKKNVVKLFAIPVTNQMIGTFIIGVAAVLYATFTLKIALSTELHWVMFPILKH